MAMFFLLTINTAFAVVPAGLWVGEAGSINNDAGILTINSLAGEDNVFGLPVNAQEHYEYTLSFQAKVNSGPGQFTFSIRAQSDRDVLMSDVQTVQLTSTLQSFEVKLYCIGSGDADIIAWGGTETGSYVFQSFQFSEAVVPEEDQRVYCPLDTDCTDGSCWWVGANAGNIDDFGLMSLDVITGTENVWGAFIQTPEADTTYEISFQGRNLSGNNTYRTMFQQYDPDGTEYHTISIEATLELGSDWEEKGVILTARPYQDLEYQAIRLVFWGGTDAAAENEIRCIEVEELDVTPPEIKSTNPISYTVDVALDTPVVITFTEPVQPIDPQADVFFLKKDGVEVSGTLELSHDQTVLTFAPAGNLPSVAILSCEVLNLKDLADNSLMPVSWTFTTAPLPGDLNGNGYIDMADVVIAQQVMTGKEASFVKENIPGDKIDPPDVLYIMQEASGLRP